MSGTVTIPNGNTNEYDNNLTLVAGTVIPTMSGGHTIVLQNYKTVNATGPAGNPGTVAVTVNVSAMPAGVGVKYEIFVDGTAVANQIISANGSFSHTVYNRNRANPVTVQLGWGVGGSPVTLTGPGTTVLGVSGSDYGLG